MDLIKLFLSLWVSIARAKPLNKKEKELSRQNSDITTEAMIKIIAKEVAEQIKFDMKEIKKSSNDTERNTQILLELINGFFVISEYGRLATTEDIIAPALPRAIELVDTRRENKIVRGLDKKY